jgi:hypothetical protein
VRVGRSRLSSAGFNTSGVDPVAAAERLRDIGVRVHVIPAGSDVSEVELGGIAAANNGDLLASPGLNDLAAIFAELAGRHRGAAMALARVNFELSLRGSKGDDNREGRVPPRQRTFPIIVEKNAKSLVAFVSGRNLRMSEWSVGISLVGPNGELFGPGSPELTINPFYLFIDVPNPAPGEWKLVAAATGPALQRATALAFIDNPEPDFFVSVRPNILSGGGTVRVAANPLYVSRLEAQGVSISGSIEGPGGFTAPLSMTRNGSGAWSTVAGPFPYDGFYRASLALDVDATATLAPGEVIFAGPATPPVSITPFTRFASAGFVVVRGEGRPCESGNPKDCDGDGIPDAEECTQFGSDIDKDGRVNWRDPDADGDEIPDAIERNLDLNRNGIPDMCERSSPRTASPPRPERVRNSCVPIRRALVEPRLVGRNWRLNDGNVSLFDFGPSEENARLALNVLTTYGATERCYVGRKGHSFSYLVADGRAPAGPVEGENCKRFDLDRASISDEQGVYALKSGKETLRSFADAAEAEGALAAILKYDFTHLCLVGEGRGSLEYMRR